MKKIVALLCVMLMLVPLAACAGSPAANGSSEKFVLKVGFDAGFPPFGYTADDGSFDGFDLALAKEVCKRLGWEMKPVSINWESKDAELASGSINCIWNGFTINDREEDYTWTVPYYDNSVVMVVRADSGIAGLADLTGKNVITQAASSALSALESEDNADLKASFADLTEVSDYNTAFMDLESGSADAIAVDVGVANYQLASKSGSFVILDEAISSEQYGVGFKKGDTATMYAVQGVLLEMAADGTMDEIAAEYADKGLVVESLVLPKAFK